MLRRYFASVSGRTFVPRFFDLIIFVEEARFAEVGNVP